MHLKHHILIIFSFKINLFHCTNYIKDFHSYTKIRIASFEDEDNRKKEGNIKSPPPCPVGMSCLHPVWLGMDGWAVLNTGRFCKGIDCMLGPLAGIWLNEPALETTWLWLSATSGVRISFWLLLHDVTSPFGFMTCRETIEEDHFLSELGIENISPKLSLPEKEHWITFNFYNSFQVKYREVELDSK